MHNEPGQRIDPHALKVWRMTDGITSLFIWLFVLGLVGLTVRYDWLWVFSVFAGVFALIASFILIVVIPPARLRTWRYEVNEREINLKYGMVFRSRTMIPMARVQHVDTEQGPLLRRYQLATVLISTAAGPHDIPALPLETANELHHQIVRWAEIADDI